MDWCRCIAAGRGLSPLTSACRGLLLLLAGARGVMLCYCYKLLLLIFRRAVDLSCGQLSLRALHVCETGGAECPAECGLWVTLSGVVARNESQRCTMYNDQHGLKEARTLVQRYCIHSSKTRSSSDSLLTFWVSFIIHDRHVHKRAVHR